MDDGERQKKLEAGKAKLAEYRQRKAHADSQKKQKKKRKRRPGREEEEEEEQAGKEMHPGEAEEEEEEEEERGGVEPEEQRQQTPGEELPRGGGVRGAPDPDTTEVTFSRTLRRGETVKHDQTYTIEPESEVSTTADDYSSEEEVGTLQQMVKEAKMDDMEEELAAKTQAVEELSRELEEIRASFGSEGIHQLQDFEAALKQRDGIITQLTSNLQQARQEKQDIMREFLEMTEQSQKLHIQFQQLQAGETLRNTTHSSTAADLLLSRQQVVQYQTQLEDLGSQVRSAEERLLAVSELELKLSRMETAGQKSEETFAQKLSEKDLLIAEKERLLSGQEESLADLRAQLALSARASEESFAHALGDKDLLISKQRTIISEHEQSLSLLRDELVHVAKSSSQTDSQSWSEKDARIADQERVISEQGHSLALLEEQLTSSERSLKELCFMKDQELRKCQEELESTRVDLERCKGGWENSKVQLENGMTELESCRDQLLHSKVELERGQIELKGCKDELKNSKLEFEKQMKELESCKKEFENSKLQLQGELKSCLVDLENSKVELEKGARELESCKEDLTSSRQKERTSSSEIMQLMGTVEDLQKRCHQGSLSEGDLVQKMEEETQQRLERLRAELDEMYGQQIVQMKQELNLQHEAAVERLTQQRQAELDALRAQEKQRGSVVDQLNAKLGELQETLRESQTAHGRAKEELGELGQEKLDLQTQVEELLQDLHLAREAAEKASHNLTLSKGSRQTELQHLQLITDSLRCQLEAAEEAALEVETKHESEVTNYKIKLEMLEREKDAVLDRMAQSQEAELERLRTQLLFSHEEELILLREDLQRESFLNTENLLNEASVKRERALEELRASYEDKLGSLGKETALFLTERGELLEQILALKEDLKVTQSSSRAEELVQQLRELQEEVRELRTGAEERAGVEGDYKALLTKVQTLEEQARLEDDSWRDRLEAQELEKRMLTESNFVLAQEVQSLTSESNRKVQEAAELRDEIERQRTTFSFAEKNFEVNYGELKGEYTCLVQAKKQLEERTLKETLEFEARIVSLLSQVQGLEEESHGGRALVEKDTTELMEKLGAISSEKESLTARLSDVTKKLGLSEGKLERLKGELLEIHQEHGKVLARNRSIAAELEREREAVTELRREGEPRRHSKAQHRAADPSEPGASSASRSLADQQRLIESLQGEVRSLRTRLPEAETDRAPFAPQKLLPLQTPSPQATTGDGPQPPASSASGSSRRKRRQRSKQERKTSAGTITTTTTTTTSTTSTAVAALAGSKRREERQRGGRESEMDQEEDEVVVEEEEGEGEEEEQQELSLARARAGRAAEPALGAGMESEASSRSDQSRGGEEGSDGETKAVRSGVALEPAMLPGRPARRERQSATQHAECRLQLEAQRVSLSQIHAAQLELLVEQASPHPRPLETQPSQGQGEQSTPELPHQQPPPTPRPDELEREREDARLQRLLLEESHREDLRGLLSHVTRLASDAEENHATHARLVELEQRLRRLASAQRASAPPSVQSASFSGTPDDHDENIQVLLSELQPDSQVVGAESEAGAEPGSVRSPGLTAQLQALRTALYQKYLQEVAALKEEHNSELRRLRAERAEEVGSGGGDRGGGGGGGGGGSLDSAPGDAAGESLARGRTPLEEKRLGENVEEEVAKVIVQMSVEFAQQSELARISKQNLQSTSSAQTQPEEEVEEEEEEEEEGEGEGEEEEEKEVVVLQPKVEKKKKKRKKKKEGEAGEKSGTSSWTEVEGEEKWKSEVRMLTSEVVRLKEQLSSAAAGAQETVQKETPKEGEEKEDDGEETGRSPGWEMATTSGGDPCSLKVVTKERNLLREHNYRLHLVLQDVLKTTAAAEETLGLHMESLRQVASPEPPPPTGSHHRSQASWQRLSTKPFRLFTAGKSFQGFFVEERSFSYEWLML